MECAFCFKFTEKPKYCHKCKQTLYCSKRCRKKDANDGHTQICGKPQYIFAIEQFQYLGELLAKGTYGQVKLYTHLPTNQKYAIQTTKKDQIPSNQIIEQLRGAYRLQKSINHPKILKLHQSIQQSNNIYKIMEFAPNKNLLNYIKNQEFEQTKIQQIFRQICQGLQHLHQQKILHRGLKLQNILLDQQNHVKISGFQNSIFGTQPIDTICGPLEFQAPEMVRGDLYSFSVDIWSIGIILYWLVCRHSPYQNMDDTQKKQAIINAQIKIDDQISQEAQDLLQKILKKDPSNRLSIQEIQVQGFLFNKKKLQVGTRLRCFATGYGMADGVVIKLMGEKVQIYFEQPRITNIVLKKKLQRIINKGDPKLRKDEIAFLSELEKWCPNPGFKQKKKVRFQIQVKEENEEKVASLIGSSVFQQKLEVTGLQNEQELPNREQKRKKVSLFIPPFQGQQSQTFHQQPFQQKVDLKEEEKQVKIDQEKKQFQLIDEIINAPQQHFQLEREQQKLAFEGEKVNLIEQQKKISFLQQESPLKISSAQKIQSQKKLVQIVVASPKVYSGNEIEFLQSPRIQNSTAKCKFFDSQIQYFEKRQLNQDKPDEQIQIKKIQPVQFNESKVEQISEKLQQNIIDSQNEEKINFQNQKKPQFVDVRNFQQDKIEYTESSSEEQLQSQQENIRLSQLKLERRNELIEVIIAQINNETLTEQKIQTPKIRYRKRGFMQWLGEFLGCGQR